jgi:POT family proton-dependent oligopeptide transporter
MPSSPPPGTLLGHPKALFLLFSTEMWERFSYYGMRALLVLSLVAAPDGADPGFGMGSGPALRLYGAFTAAVYFTPLIGGWLADNHIGQRRSVLIGALVIAAGQFTLAAAVPGNLALFYAGLVLLVIGNGFFKANISTMVGMLYLPGDARRDAAFTIFYMGINIGAFFSPFVCSTLGEDPAWGWRYGYFAAGCGMLVAVAAQALFARALLGEVGLAPSRRQAQQDAGNRPLTGEEKDRLRVILMLFVFCVLFWAAFEQQGGLINLYTKDKTDRLLGGFELPAGWFQSVNPLFIVVLGPIFAALWSRLGRRGRNPPSPVKMIFGLLLTAFGFLMMVVSSFDHSSHGKANMVWLLLSYLLQTMGELCLSPIGLSMTTKLAPARLASVVMGVWFLNNFVGNYLSGLIGGLTERLDDATIFGGIAIFLIVFAAMLWAISGRLVEWMHGAETVAEPAS